MGEVYRARDTRLDRDVAVKILPERLAGNAGLESRFAREAKAVAALSHPNILAIHDIGIADGIPFSVTELLEGATLRDRIGESPLPVRKAVDYALQTARGLAAAHDKGIVHRDLKPENIFITDDGRAKILDFGLARATETESGSSLTGLPTQSPGTEPGTVLGTVGYMSPEQVRGLAVDARSDLFSFGAVLFEMLSGRRAFKGDTAADTMTAVLREDPPELTLAARSIPPALDRIVRHCLEKNPAERFQSTRDLVFSLEALSTASGSGAVEAITNGRRGSAAAPGKPGARFVGILAGLLAGAAAGAVAALWLARPAPAEPPTIHHLSYSGRDAEPSSSSDGRLIAYSSIRDGRSQIWLKQYPGGDEVALTSGPDERPRISPDGSQVLFVRVEGREHSLYRIPVVGGEPRKVLDDAYDGDWSPNGERIVFVREETEAGAVRRSVRTADTAGQGEQEIARAATVRLDYLRWSPDGKTIAALQSGAENAAGSILLIKADGSGQRTLDPPPPAGQLSAVAWSGPGRSIVYAQTESLASGSHGGSGRILKQDVVSGKAESLLWIPDMADVIEILGPGRLLLGASSLRSNLREISLAGDAGRTVRWLTRGNSIDRQPTFSPDGQWVLFSSNRSGRLDVWKLSVTTGAVRRITEDPADDWDPAFTPDGKSILWSSSRGGHFEIWNCAIDGTGARQVTHDGVDAENPTATRDGQWIVYNSGNPAGAGIWKIHPDGTGASIVVPGIWSTPEVSPDGCCVAFRRGTAPRDVQVARIADGTILGLRIEVGSEIASGRPRWMPDGKSLAFTGTDASGNIGIFVETFSPAPETRATRRPLAGFDPNQPLETYGLSPDGTNLIYSAPDRLDYLMLAEGITGVTPPERAGR